MQQLMTIFMAIVFSMTAMAASKTNKTTTAAPTFNVKKLKGFSVVGYLSLAQKFPTKTTVGNVDAKSESAFGLGAEYATSLVSKTNKLPLTVIFGGTLELPREIDSVSRNGQTAAITGSTPKLSLLTAYTNLSYRTTDQLSLFGGLNYAIPMESNFEDVNLEASVGFQAGLRMDFAKNFGADVTYRTINLTGSNGISRIDIDGILLKGRYIF